MAWRSRKRHEDYGGVRLVAWVHHDYFAGPRGEGLVDWSTGTVILQKGTKVEKDTPYGEAFFAGLAAGSSRSADLVVPELYRRFSPQSVLDVGCGTGAWLHAWMREGITDLQGVDGPYVDAASLDFPADRFVPHDLATPLDLDRRFDLVTALEVAEHIPSAASDTFIRNLVQHGDLILFSAAVPGQGGTGHINEQWPSYWAGKFAPYGYRVYDVIRQEIWDDVRIEPWYRQNLLIFCAPSRANELQLSPGKGPIDIVHPELFMRMAHRTISEHLKHEILVSRAVDYPIRAARRVYSAVRGRER